MKKLALLGMLVACSSLSYADNLPAETKVNCDTLKLSMGSSISKELKVVPYWKNPAVFPNPPTEGSVGKDGEPYRIECPNLSVFDDGNAIEIKATDYQSLIDAIPKYSQDLNFYGESSYRYPNIREGFSFRGYSFNIINFKLKSSIYDLKEGMDLSKNISLILGVPSQVVLAYKVDGGELKPLIYDRKVSRYLSDFKNANVIDIYQKLDKPMVMERLTIDKNNASIRMYRTNPFPKL